MSVERQQYRQGCIVRLRMVDFMHYQDQTVEPLPGFNVVIGHNGSGKSAIVNALCIGLGGDIESLQRCENLTTFVRRGAKEANISIELYNPEGENWVVESSLSARGKLSWSLGGRRASKDQVSDLVSKLSIQTGNMCQFLPQDVVKSFPLMSPQNRFLNTVRAVGEGRLVDQFDKLKDIQQQISQNTGLIETKESTLSNLQAKIETISQKKSKLDEVEVVLNAKQMAEKKMKWVVFENDIARGKKANKICAELKKKKQELEKTITECENINKDKETEMSALAEEMSEPESFLRDYEKSMIDPETSRKMMKLEHTEQLMRAELEDQSDRHKSLEKTKAEIAKITRDLKHCTDDALLEAELTKLKAKESEITNKNLDLNNSKAEFSYTLKSLTQTCRATEKSLKDLKSAETQKLNQLKKSNSDVHGAVMYLRSHLQEWRDSGRFRGGVHEPAVLTLTVPNLNNAVFIEKETGSQQLEAFVCEEATEASDLMQELRKHFKKVSVIHGDLSKLRQFEEGGTRYRERHTARELDRFKFVSYVADMFTALSKVNYDQEEISRLEQKLKDSRAEMSSSTKAIEKIKEQEGKNKGDLSQIKKDIEEINQARQSKNTLEISLKHKNELLSQSSKVSHDSNHFQKIEQYKQDRKQATMDLVKSVKDAQELTAKASLQYVKKSLIQLKQNHLHDKYSSNTTKLNRATSELNEVTAQLETENNKLNDIKDDLRRSKDEAQSSTSDEVRPSVEEGKVTKKPPPEYAAAFQGIEAKTVEELKAHIEALDKELGAANTLIAERVKINKMFTEKLDCIKAVEGELKVLRQEVAKAEEESTRISTVGVEKLQELVEKVNDKFGSYFADLGYAGQVSLCRRQVDDYKSYGISIKVKFRDEAELSELSRGRQSGGEMSVTTAVYMLALQEMTTVPFRCVDEINQGLDERNERRVWDMILNAATKGQGSQYFYLAPKMPYNLNYRPGTVVHVCHASNSIQSSFSSSSLGQSEGRRWVEAARRLQSN